MVHKHVVNNMNGKINYVILIIIIVSVLISTYYSNKKKKRIDEYLQSLETNYPNKIKANGRVKFSRLRILLNSDLNILYSDNHLLIYGFDYYSDRRTKFIFHTNENLKANQIPNYLITKIEIIENEKIVITNENDCEITFLFKSYGKEKKQLKEPKFIELINKLNKDYLQQLV